MDTSDGSMARWLDARWLDGSMAGSTARSMWLDGSMLTEDVFSLDALMPDSVPVLMPSSMLRLDAWLDAGSMLARCVARCVARCRLDAGSMPLEAGGGAQWMDSAIRRYYLVE
jgi:hypothetical protein